jgi:DNA-binding LacI/PurR family transcriptional regulator
MDSTVAISVPKRATIYDVARLAGVSHNTVTRALSKGNVSIKPGTREKILHAARQLNYQPNPLARGLNGAQTNTIAVIWPVFVGYRFISEQYLTGLAMDLQAAGYSTQLANVLQDPAMIKSVLDSMLQRSVDAVVLHAPEMIDLEMIEILKRFKAAVVINAMPFDFECDQVVWDRSTAIKNIVDHLVSRNRKRIAFCWLKKTRLPGGQTYLREQYKAEAFISQLLALGIEKPEQYVITSELDIAADDVHGLERLLGSTLQDKTFDAIVCTNDELAAIALNVVKSKGLRVPEDVAIVGFNNSMTAELCRPNLASVERCNPEVVKAVEHLLLSRLKGERKEAARQIKIEMQFMWRESAG